MTDYGRCPACGAYQRDAATERNAQVAEPMRSIINGLFPS